MTQPSVQWLIYALGSGFGHLTRASALARFAPPDNRVRILTNSPYAPCVRRSLPELDIVAFDPDMTVAQAYVEVIRQIESARPECLIVDTFPRGLGGELVDALSSFPAARVLVQRDLNPRYAAAFDLNTFVREAYDLVLIPGDSTGDSLGPFPQTTITAPWLVRSPSELPPRARACDWLGLHASQPCVLVCAAGNPDELHWYGEVVSRLLVLAPALEVRCIAPECPPACPPAHWCSYWPAMDLYAAADVVIGSAGYNTIYECQACAVPLIARPWPRKYDRQRLRAMRAAVTIVEDPGHAAAAALAILANPPSSPRPGQFHNGAIQAVTAIQRLHRPKSDCIQRSTMTSIECDTDSSISGC